MSDYNADSIKVLKGLDAVIKRPGMYIGNTTDEEGTGLHHMLYEALDNSIDEAMAGYCDKIEVILNPDDSITVTDYGRGIPTGINEEEGVSACELVFTRLHAGGKFDNDAYSFSGGTHGVGISVVNALSRWCEVTVKQLGKVHYQRYEMTKPIAPLTVIGKCKKNETGTSVSFLPRDDIFTQTTFSYNRLKTRIRNLTYFNKGITISLTDLREKTPKTEVFYSKDGLSDFIGDKLQGKDKVYSIVSGTEMTKEMDIPVEVGVSFTWTNNSSENIYAYTNSIPQTDGTHMTGFKNAIARVLTKRIKEYVADKRKRAPMITPNDIREGLLAIISIKLPDPKYSSQTKEKLVSTEARGAVERITAELLNNAIDANYKAFETLANNIFRSAKARENARAAREQVKGKGSVLASNPSKLASAQSRNPEECELYIVEGESAGGSAKQGRNKKTQAILPLKGKLINSESANIAEVLKSVEVLNIINAIGAGFKDNFNPSKAKYGKVIIMTDADDDGMHIEALLLTFFINFMPELIMEGKLYVATSPLYRVMDGKKAKYLNSKEELLMYALNKHKEHVTSLMGLPIAKVRTLAKLNNQVSSLRSCPSVAADVLTHHLMTGEPIANCVPNCREDGSFMVTSPNGGSLSFHPNQVTEEDMNTIRSLANFLTQEGLSMVSNREFNCEIERLTQSLKLTRFKGLGEMNPDELYSTTMDPERRLLKRIDITQLDLAHEAKSLFMSSDTKSRSEYLRAHSSFLA